MYEVEGGLFMSITKLEDKNAWQDVLKTIKALDPQK